jgi:YhcH/YjgK/YiaL family protein
MKRIFFSGFSLAIVFAVILTSCHSSAKISGSKTNDPKVAKWYQSRDWLKGLQLTPHSSINQQEFYRQYQLNNKWWDEAFAFLKTHDLASMKPGTYVIDSNNVVATISELTPKQRDEVNWEGHRNFNDLQYIITGKAVMGVAQITDPKTTVKTPYDSKGDVEVFSVDNPAYYDAEPGTFFIFSPKDIHRPAFRAAGYDTIKKIVIKVRVPQGS